MSSPSQQKYFLPSFLEGTVSLKEFSHWLDERAGQLFVRDQKRKIPYAQAGEAPENNQIPQSKLTHWGISLSKLIIYFS